MKKRNQTVQRTRLNPCFFFMIFLSFKKITKVPMIVMSETRHVKRIYIKIMYVKEKNCVYCKDVCWSV